MEENGKDIKKCIDEAERELREKFNEILFDYGDTDGSYFLHNRTSGFNTLLEYARKWQAAMEEEESGEAPREGADEYRRAALKAIEELESKNRYIAKLEGVVREAEGMLDAIVEEGHEEAERSLREYLKERYGFKQGNTGRGLYDYLTSTVR
jgi:hypothetical protein